MEIEWMNHTGFVVKDMESALAFYKGLLGLKEERNLILEGDIIAQLTGYPDTRLHIVYLSTGDMRHAVELIQYLNPKGIEGPSPQRHQVGAAHLGLIVDDLDAFYTRLTEQGIRFVNPPTYRPDAVYPWSRKACYLQDPDGNWLEFIERPPAPPDAKIV